MKQRVKSKFMCISDDVEFLSQKRQVRREELAREESVAFK